VIPKITVYVVSHNYGKYLSEAIESVLRQTFSNWELLIFDDGSSDDTQKIMDLYRNHEKISCFTTKGIGLPAVNNLALEAAKGEYIVRLDADDKFEENILLIFDNYVSKKPDLALLFPDFYLMDESGEVFAHKMNSSPHEEDHLMDVPPNGACTLVKTNILKDLGGYREDLGAQDGLDLWLKIKDKFPTYKINLPLFYYRRHGKNLTDSPVKIIKARQQLKKSSAINKLNSEQPVLAIIPCRRNYDFMQDLWSAEINGKLLLEKSIQTCLSSDLINKVIVTCDNQEVNKVLDKFQDKRLCFHGRDEVNTLRSSNISNTVQEILKIHDENYSGVSILNFVQTPFVSSDTLEEALTSLMSSEAESSFAVQEVEKRIFRRGPFGLEAVNSDPESYNSGVALYQDSSACIAFKNKNLQKGSIRGARSAGFTVSSEEAFFISSKNDLLFAKELEKSY
tara:strand:+ start:1810 stop:3165 length:1356 start_codon:yes stop_codon:yes gene_type:complete